MLKIISMNVLLIEPYFTGSHAVWAGGYSENSRHNVDILSLEGRYWKWRMHGGAVTLASRFLETGKKPDLLFATDMLDLTTFLALTRTVTSDVPVAVYFHENQLTYPWSPLDRDRERGRDGHYGFINFSTALAADRVFFNSSYHMEVFLSALGNFLKGFPDNNELESIELIKEKSRVLALGMDFSLLDNAGSEAEKEGEGEGEGAIKTPLILWNHRWEHDKNPEEFFKALYILAEKGLDFEVAVLGENFKKSPEVFDEAAKKLGRRVVQFGFVKNAAEYARWLMRSDILPVTSVHDFFGASVVEAIYAGCFPILPNRLAYPEHLPKELHKKFLYNDFNDLVARLEAAIVDIENTRKINLKKYVQRYCWNTMAQVYDKELEGLI